MSSQRADAAGLRLLVVGASSGIGHAVAVSATERGAKVAVAARRIDLLNSLAEVTGGHAFELDVEDSAAINRVVNDAADALGGLDAVVFTSTVIPFAYIEDTDVATWLHAFSVNTVGANNVLRRGAPTRRERCGPGWRPATTWVARGPAWRRTAQARPPSTRSCTRGASSIPSCR